MTTPHTDWPKTLEWIEKQSQESLKARFATAELIAKETQTTLTVVLAGVGGSAAYAAKIFDQGPLVPIVIGASAVCAYFILIAIILVIKCMMFQSYPALYQDPENLMHPAYSLDEIREEEIKNLGVRIKEAAKINSERAARLNKLRVAIAISPILFAACASIISCELKSPLQDTKTVLKANNPTPSTKSKIEFNTSKQ